MPRGVPGRGIEEAGHSRSFSPVGAWCRLATTPGPHPATDLILLTTISMHSTSLANPPIPSSGPSPRGTTLASSSARTA
eukprot:7244716-Pyramimonas_sp.AAC.1